MNADQTVEQLAELEAIAELLVKDLASIGSVSYERRLSGFALCEDDVMFGFVEADGTPYLRATLATAQLFHSLGSHKHSEMPYWSVPAAVAADLRSLRDLAYQAADNAHLAASFGIEDLPGGATPTLATRTLGVVRFALLAA